MPLAFRLTRAFSISRRCRSKEVGRPSNATYPAHYHARSSLWDGRYSETPTGPRTPKRGPSVHHISGNIALSAARPRIVSASRSNG